MDEMLSIHETSRLLGVTVKTLKLWDSQKKLEAAYRTVGGHRRYRLSDIEECVGKMKSKKERIAVYCRVSTKKQAESGNLDRQEERLLDYCKSKGYEITKIYKEIASGINENRRELIKMLNNLTDIDKIVIEYEDRLARFGYNYLKVFAGSHNVEIETVEQNVKLEPNVEMVSDLVSIVTCFSAKIYGARGGRKLKTAITELERERQGERHENHS